MITLSLQVDYRYDAAFGDDENPLDEAVFIDVIVSHDMVV